MKVFPIFLCLIHLSLGSFIYPEVRRNQNSVDDYFGTKIQDPYRWLEDLESNETKSFVDQQSEFTINFLKKAKSKEAIRQRLSELWNFPRSTSPIKAGSRYFFFENTGLQNFYVLFVQDSLDGPRREVLDINKLSDDGSISMDPYEHFFDITHDGDILAYSVQKNGADWRTIYFRNVTTGEDLPDKLELSKFPYIQWSPDDKGIFYSRRQSKEDNPDSNRPSVYYHTLGTSQKEDILIAVFPNNPDIIFLQSQVTDDKNYLVLTLTQTFNENGIYIFPLKDGVDETLKDKIIPVFPNATQAAYKYIGNLDTTFLFQTNYDTPNFKLVTVHVDVTQDGSKGPRIALISTFLNEHPKNVIDSASIVDRNKLLISYVNDVKHTMELRCLISGKLFQTLDLPPGQISWSTSKLSKTNELFFSLSNFVSPGTIYRCIVNGSRADCQVFKQPAVPNTNLSSFVTQQVFYPSKDGTMIPMYILRKKGVRLDNSAPAILYGYGGFAVSLLPSYAAKYLAFVDNFNGVFALANIRGGGEYGKSWYDGGAKLNKQASFDDFQAAAEYLINNNYTSASKLAIEGASNGGLLVSACVNQRPELYGAAIVDIGIMDMIRIRKFTIGFIACSEYGCPDNKETFEILYRYSPLHNIHLPESATVQYPAVLVTTADHDDRAPPLHSYKYAAELQNTIGKSPRQTNPLLLLVAKNTGHGTGVPTSQKIDDATNILSFIAETLDLEFKP